MSSRGDKEGNLIGEGTNRCGPSSVDAELIQVRKRQKGCPNIVKAVGLRLEGKSPAAASEQGIEQRSSLCAFSD